MSRKYPSLDAKIPPSLTSAEVSLAGKRSAWPRSSGLLLHISSLPARYGIGDLGPTAIDFVDTLARAGQTWWQILPLGPPGAGNSPYQCFSAMAGNPMLISPDLLRREGLLPRHDVYAVNLPDEHVDFNGVSILKNALLAQAWDRFRGGQAPGLKSDFENFRAAEAGWLDDFALFMALRSARDGKTWIDWPRDLVFRKTAAMKQSRRELADTIGLHAFTQFLFFRQLDALRAYAAGKGVKIIGDLPIFVSGDSSDVWAHSHQFLLDKSCRPTHVAGVPPDYFSATGQRWGNPLYHWRAMKQDGFAWWIDRTKMALHKPTSCGSIIFAGSPPVGRFPPASQRLNMANGSPRPARNYSPPWPRKLANCPSSPKTLA